MTIPCNDTIPADEQAKSKKSRNLLAVGFALMVVGLFLFAFASAAGGVAMTAGFIVIVFSFVVGGVTDKSKDEPFRISRYRGDRVWISGVDAKQIERYPPLPS
ncbi:membrane protein [Rhodopirellula maiorica SM1]|uniref:Membrane protein n=1 Tax=Rhodopirellula maiorica SM1 TaxID=1265738 RepID=M5R9Z9_9BACT|nr:hypothetical protein [Rhodopirellula maiorica]EMI16308.1 membrane protein [Rhodopirellula maiorica SM1]